MISPPKQQSMQQVIQESGLDEIFSQMEKKFQKTFNEPSNLQENINKQNRSNSIGSNRSPRRLKPIYSPNVDHEQLNKVGHESSDKSIDSGKKELTKEIGQKGKKIKMESLSPGKKVEDKVKISEIGSKGNEKNQEQQLGMYNEDRQYRQQRKQGLGDIEHQAKNQQDIGQYGQLNSNRSSPYGKMLAKSPQSQEYTKMIQSSQDGSPNGLYRQQNMEDLKGISLKQTQTSPKKSTKVSASNVTRHLTYTELQQRIESALKKNSAYKKSYNGTQLTQSNYTTRSFSEFNESLLGRFDDYQQKKEKELQRKRQQLQEKKGKELVFRPKINKKSEKFVEEMGGYDPIEKRYEKIIDEKNRKMKYNEEARLKKEEEEYQLFLEEFQQYKKNPSSSTRSYEKFYEEMYNWKQRSLRHNEEKKKLELENMMKDFNNFRPKISKKSEKILSNKTHSHIPIYQREITGDRCCKVKHDQQCTFKPKINKRKVK